LANNSGKTCVAKCKSLKFKFAATQYSSQCFCGNSFGKYGKSTNCNMKCKGNKKETCGGSWANTIYKVE